MTRLIAGGYADAGACGLYPLDLAGGTLSAGAPVAGHLNVSAGVRIPDTGRWFLVDERANRIVLVDAAQDWRTLASVDAGGEGPCHLALDRSARLLAVAHYDGGSLAVFRLDPASGQPIEPPAVHRNQGRGPDNQRQRGPHVHWVGFGPDDRLYVVDLGLDQVQSFAVDADTGTLGEPVVAHVAPPGSGPRQLAFHPHLPVAYLVSELVPSVTVLRRRGDGTFAAAPPLSTMPAGEVPASLGGGILIGADASRLYVSNRGHDSIATFALDPDGDAGFVAATPSGGRSPRFLLATDTTLLVAHEQAGGVTVLPLDDAGVPYPASARADVPSAAFLGVVDA